MNALKVKSVLTFVFVVLGAGTASAFPQFITYQGRYLNAGVPGTGTVEMEFRVTNGNTVACGTALPATNLFWTSGARTIELSSGVFGYKIGLQSDQSTQDSAFLNINWNLTNTIYHIDVCAGGVSLTPHDKIGASVYALYSSSAGYAVLTSSAGAVINVADTLIQADSGATGTGAIRLRTGATDKLTLTNAGNVGIGTAAPLSKLDVNGGMAVGGYAGVNAAPANGTIISGNVGIGTASPAAKLHLSSGTLLIDGDIATSLTTTGKIGIGTAAPLSKLDVNGGMAVGSYAGVSAAPANGTIISGNVGIGTTGPGAKLDVRGASGATLKIVDTNQGANKVLTSDANGNASWQTPASGGSSVPGFSNFKRYFYAGNFSFAVPAEATKLLIEMWGSGGAGGSGVDYPPGGGEGCMASGGGGSGGNYAKIFLSVADGSLTPGTDLSVTVGAGGASLGSNGGSTSIKDANNPIIFVNGGSAGGAGTKSGDTCVNGRCVLPQGDEIDQDFPQLVLYINGNCFDGSSSEGGADNSMVNNTVYAIGGQAGGGGGHCGPGNGGYGSMSGFSGDCRGYEGGDGWVIIWY
jgi:hypothetical protein